MGQATLVRRLRARTAGLGITSAFAIAAVIAGCADDAPQVFAPRPDPAANKVVVAPRTPLLTMLPCQDGRCHTTGQISDEVVPLDDFHRGKLLNHGATIVWCAWCHSTVDLTKLRLLDGSEVGFDDGYMLCGQCHGDRLRDWHLGIHGRQTGSWAGVKTRLSCPACHNPHQPKFQPIEAKPAPLPLRAGPTAVHEESHHE
ncbi:cytochrome C [Myxococcota bacterium]|nr:cytochrome C [Myxococcota bacterium]